MDITLKRMHRKTLTLYVHADKTVEVRAPIRMHSRDIWDFVNTKKTWINKQFLYFEQNPPDARTRPTHGDGTPYFYLGKRYLLRYIRSNDTLNKPEVRLKAHHIEIAHTVAQTTMSPKTVQSILDQWTLEQAKHILPERLRSWLPMLETLGINPNKLTRITVRRMRSRWGSCGSNGRITLNSLLVHHSLAAIDYVICHELCHLKEMNHSNAFYALLNQLVPNWHALREQLHKTPLSY